MELHVSWIAGLALAGALAACAAPPADESGGAPAPVTVRLIRQGVRCPVDKPERVVVSTPREWSDLWRRMGTPESELDKTPAVDLSKERVVALFMGSQRTGGYAIAIARVESTDAATVVHVKTTKPGPGDVVTQAFTSPFYIAAIPRTEKPVKFADGEPK